MKKLLVAAIAAALTFTGIAAPASATVVSSPSIPASIMPGDTVAATPGVYTGETVSGRSWLFCTSLQTQATLEDSSALGVVLGDGTCDYVSLSNVANPENGTSVTLPTVVYGNWDRSARLIAGKYLTYVEVTGTGPWVRHASNSVLVGTPPATNPRIVTSTSSDDVPVGSTISIQNGVNLPEIGGIFDSGLYFCNYDPSNTLPASGWDLYADSLSAPQYCDMVGRNTGINHQGAPSYPYTIGSDIYLWSSSNHAFPSAGKYLIYYEMYRVGYTSVYHTYYSQAVYVGVRAQTVTYNANTGSGSVAASVANGARNVADGSGFSNPGFTFAGWNTAANGSGTAIAGGASYTPSGNVTLYAQWNRTPTPPAPAFTSPISVAPVGGVLNLTGANMAAVTSITVDDMPATISTSSSGSVSVKLPTLAPGKYDITIKNADGGIRFIDGLVVPDPNAKVLPKPTTTFVATSAVKVTGTAPSAKQAAAIKTFVAQYKKAKTVTVFIRTSKAGLAAAKKAAAAMLATAVKAIGTKVVSGIVVDSTSEKTTALDLVVTD